MAIMLSVGLASFAFVDTNQKRARESRERESSLSLAEGALYAQGFALARAWPNATQSPLTADCSSALTRPSSAPTATRWPPRARATAPWRSSTRPTSRPARHGPRRSATNGRARRRLRPGAGEQHPRRPVYGACPITPCRMDWNRDRQLWVQSSAIVRGRPTQHRRADEARGAPRERAERGRGRGRHQRLQQRQQPDGRRERGPASSCAATCPRRSARTTRPARCRPRPWAPRPRCRRC